MNIKQYENFAVVALRLVGICFFVVGLIWCIYAVIFLLPTDVNTAVSYIVPTLCYVVFAVLLFALSKPLAALAVKGLKDE